MYFIFITFQCQIVYTRNTGLPVNLYDIFVKIPDDLGKIYMPRNSLERTKRKLIQVFTADNTVIFNKVFHFFFRIKAKVTISNEKINVKK